MVISVFFSVLGLSLGAGLIIDFVSVRDGLIIAPTFRYRDHIAWNSLKIISEPNSFKAHALIDAQHGRSGATGTPPKLGLNRGGVRST